MPSDNPAEIDVRAIVEKTRGRLLELRNMPTVVQTAGLAAILADLTDDINRLVDDMKNGIDRG